MKFLSSQDPVFRSVQRRTIIAAVAFTVVAAAFAAMPSRASYRTEKWVRDSVPKEVAGYRFVKSDPKLVDCTYDMDQGTYDTLKPWGICARVFEGTAPDTKGQAYDVVVIGGNSKDSFHDPAVCFTAQNWLLTNYRVDKIQTMTRGEVPVTIVDMQQGSEKSIALYTYRLREGYVAGNFMTKLQMLAYKFKAFGRDDEGGFIRIIPRSSTATAEQLKAFTARWIDTASNVSHGYY